MSSLSNPEGTQQLYRVDPDEVDVLGILEREANGSGEDCGHNFWNMTLGVDPEGRRARMHKKIPANLGRLRLFQKVRQLIFHIIICLFLKFNPFLEWD